MRRLFFLYLFFLSIHPIFAQSDCGIVDSIRFPVNTDSFELAQDYAVASSRHQGRYHTGEDWYGGRGTSAGQSVQAIAKGRVTFSAPNGWGRDGGVIIIEHTLSDGTIFYSHYGHIAESSSVSFPPRSNCVQMGDVIAVIDDVRPAPHLHFEIRSQFAGAGVSAGAGYSRENPYLEGYRNPSKFILNLQTWLSSWHWWHSSVGTESPRDERGLIAPPLVLDDESLLYLNADGTTLRRITNDGRILWRARLENPAIAITAWQGSSLLTFVNGAMQSVDVEAGTLGESWRVEAQFTGAPIIADNDLLFPAVNNELVRIAANRREITGRIADVPSFTRAHLLPNAALAIISESNEFSYYAADGNLINRSQLNTMASFARSWEGELLAYTQGGLWQVDSTGQWSLYIEDAPNGGESASILVTTERLYLFTGQRLLAYNRDFTLLWNTALPPVSGQTELALYDGILLLTSNHGNIVLAMDTGNFCNQGRIFGRDNARQWHHFGDDGALRLAVSDQLMGILWRDFTRQCRV